MARGCRRYSETLRWTMAQSMESRAREVRRREPRLAWMRKYLRTDRRYSAPHCTQYAIACKWICTHSTCTTHSIQYGGQRAPLGVRGSLQHKPLTSFITQKQTRRVSRSDQATLLMEEGLTAILNRFNSPSPRHNSKGVATWSCSHMAVEFPRPARLPKGQRLHCTPAWKCMNEGAATSRFSMYHAWSWGSLFRARALAWL